MERIARPNRGQSSDIITWINGVKFCDWSENQPGIQMRWIGYKCRGRGFHQAIRSLPQYPREEITPVSDNTLSETERQKAGSALDGKTWPAGVIGPSTPRTPVEEHALNPQGRALHAGPYATMGQFVLAADFKIHRLQQWDFCAHSSSRLDRQNVGFNASKSQSTTRWALVSSIRPLYDLSKPTRNAMRRWAVNHIEIPVATR